MSAPPPTSTSSTCDSSCASPPSSPLVINGNVASQSVRSSLASEIASLIASNPSLPPPSLAVILVGSRKDSQTYVNAKAKACVECGIIPHQFTLPEETKQEELMELIQKLNEDPKVHGILVQLPLPSHCNADELISFLNPVKDVDGLTSTNAGELLRLGDQAHLVACTPLGCLDLLDQYKIPLEGKHAVVLGRSNLVGKPVAQLLLSRNATVTMCHSRTANLPSVISSADILIAAIGKAEFVRGEWVSPGTVVIDVGINAKTDPSKKLGYRLVGDVAYDECVARGVKAITPVPGGVGPMTVAMLMRNTLKAWKWQKKLKEEREDKEEKEKEKQKH